MTSTIKAVKASDNTYKIGLWVRDAAAGVGTVTFYEAETGKFAALGHRNYWFIHWKTYRYWIRWSCYC